MTETARARNLLYQTLMRVTHRDYAPLVASFHEALEQDPDFTARACVHVCTGGSKIRDQQDAAIIALLQASPTFPEYREAGRCLLLGRDVYKIEPDSITGLPPFRIFRTRDFILSRFGLRFKGEDIGLRFLLEKKAKQRISVLVNETKNPKRKTDFVKRFGRRVNVGDFSVFTVPDFRPIPRLMRSMMRDYCMMLEADHARLDGIIIYGGNRRALKSIWISDRGFFKESRFPYLHALLFEKDPPTGSKQAILKRIAHSTNPREQFQLAQEHKIPYMVLVSVLPKVTPAVGITLIGAMSPTDALNSRAWVERSGLLEIAEVKDAYVAKVAKAQASVASAEHRVSAKGTDEVVEAAVTEAKEKAVAKEQRIERRTLIAVDRSGSMDRAITTGLQFLVRIAPLCDDFMVVFFNDYARISEGSWDTLSSAQQSVKGIRASGRTSMRVALETAIKAGFDPEQVVFISDGGENVDSYSSLLGNLLSPPHTIMLRIPGETNVLTPRISRAGHRIDTFETTGEDYYIFDQVTALLGGPPALSLVERILATELPRRMR